MQFTLDGLKALFKPRPVRITGQKLYISCVSQARQPIFYLDYGIEDAIGARFELLVFHVGLVIYALKSTGASDPRHEQAKDTAQTLFDAFLEALDDTLREQGTGDLTVPKKMKSLGQVVYTRMKAWDDMWTAGASLADQAAYAARTIFAGSAYDNEGVQAGESAAISAAIQTRANVFADYVQRARSLDIDQILRGRLDWADIPSVPEDDAGMPAAATGGLQ